MTAPITPDERAEWRALADAATRGPWEASRDDLTDDMNVVHDQEHRVWVAHTGTHGMAGAEPDAEFIAAARTAVPRLLDALDTAEAERDEARAEVARLRGPHPCCEHCAEDPVHDVVPEEHGVPCTSCEADTLLGRARRERDDALAEVARLREEAARPAPVWDEDTVTEAIASILESDWHGEYTCECTTERCPVVPCPTSTPTFVTSARAVLAVVRERMPVRPDRMEVARLVCAAVYGDPDNLSRANEATDAVLALWPGESRATVQAEALRDWISEWPTTPDDGTFLADVARDGLARADRLEKGADRG